MNLKNLPSCVLLGAFCVGVAHADWITSWGNGVQGVDFFINQLDPSITILKGNGNEYKFFSETSNGSGVPGVIDDITVSAGASGDFTIWIQDDSTRVPHPVRAATGWGTDRTPRRLQFDRKRPIPIH